MTSPSTRLASSTLCVQHGIKSRRQRLQESGLLTIADLAAMLDTSPTMIWYWRCHGVLRGEPYGTNRFLYYPPSPEVVEKLQAKEPYREVQCVN